MCQAQLQAPGSTVVVMACPHGAGVLRRGTIGEHTQLSGSAACFRKAAEGKPVERLGEGFLEEVAFEQEPERIEEDPPSSCRVSGGGNSNCKGLRVGPCLCPRKGKAASRGGGVGGSQQVCHRIGCGCERKSG